MYADNPMPYVCKLLSFKDMCKYNDNRSIHKDFVEICQSECDSDLYEELFRIVHSQLADFMLTVEHRYLHELDDTQIAYGRFVCYEGVLYVYWMTEMILAVDIRFIDGEDTFEIGCTKYYPERTMTPEYDM